MIKELSPGSENLHHGWSPQSVGTLLSVTKSPLTICNRSPWLACESPASSDAIKTPCFKNSESEQHRASSMTPCLSEDQPDSTDSAHLSLSGKRSLLDSNVTTTHCSSDNEFENIKEAATRKFNHFLSGFSRNRSSVEISSISCKHSQLRAGYDQERDLCYSSRRSGPAPSFGSCRGRQLKKGGDSCSGLSLQLPADSSQDPSIQPRSSRGLRTRREGSTPATLRHASPPARITTFPVWTTTSLAAAPAPVGRCVYVITPPSLRPHVMLHPRMSPRGL